MIPPLKRTFLPSQMEHNMQYKTLTLHLLEQRAEIHDYLRRQRLLITTLDRYSEDLKASHEAYQERLTRSRADWDRSQIASEALELALKDLENRLRTEFPPQEEETMTLEGAMDFIRRRTPPA